MGLIAVMSEEEYEESLEIDNIQIFPNLNIVINTLQYPHYNVYNRCCIYLNIPEIYKHNSLIIDIVLTLPCNNNDDLKYVIVLKIHMHLYIFVFLTLL